MSITEELREMMEEVIFSGTEAEDTERKFELLGIEDHDGVRQWGHEYGEGVSRWIEAEHGPYPELAEHMGASLVGGFLLGLYYARTHQEEVMGPPLDLGS